MGYLQSIIVDENILIKNFISIFILMLFPQTKHGITFKNLSETKK